MIATKRIKLTWLAVILGVVGAGYFAWSEYDRRREAESRAAAEKHFGKPADEVLVYVGRSGVQMSCRVKRRVDDNIPSESIFCRPKCSEEHLPDVRATQECLDRDLAAKRTPTPSPFQTGQPSGRGTR